MPDTCKIKILLDSRDMDLCKHVGYKLCLARHVRYEGAQTEGNVVFSALGGDDLALNMEFAFSDNFRVYGTNEFQEGARVQTRTKFVDIEGGQEAEFDETGSARVSGSVQRDGPFLVKNALRQVAYVGVQCFNLETDKFGSIFVSPALSMASTSEILPINKFSVFWARDMETDTMFNPSYTPSFQFELTGRREITVQYRDGKWILAT